MREPRLRPERGREEIESFLRQQGVPRGRKAGILIAEWNAGFLTFECFSFFCCAFSIACKYRVKSPFLSTRLSLSDCKEGLELGERKHYLFF